MRGMISNHTRRLLTALLMLVCIGGSALAFQTNVSGVINQYGRVTGIGAGYVNVSDPVQFSKFAAGDTVLLIQMKGAQADVTEAFQFGNLQAFEGSPGKYEFLIIQSKSGLDKIIFRNNIINSYDLAGDIQIVKTASYNSVVVNADLSCAPWDSLNKIGGVLTMIVGKTVKLNANIDVTGKGFLGGGIDLSIAECANSNPALLNKYTYHLDSDSSGIKGESVVTKGWIDFATQVPIFPSYAKGKGANFTGGGGGNGYYSGGGGGANYGVGGKGGKEKGFCLPTFIPVDGGVGGKPVKFTGLEGGIFSGGGGGSSTYTGGATATPGGNGGGIIIIVCDSIIGNGKIIKAEGAAALAATGNAGAGGGGGGGSIALYLGGFSTSNLTISANGGKGGDNSNVFGEGGGGGGGLIWINNIPVPGNVTRTVLGGLVGTRSGASTGGGGAPGEGSLTDFVALLNGFLFNSIRSSVTGDQIDSICSNMLPRKIYGTKPVGGTKPYTTLWEKSYDEITWIPLTNDADPTNYTPTVIETATVFFRRTITDSSVPALVDVSKPVKIIVQPFIKNNIIGTSDTICSAQNPPAFTSKAILADGNGVFTYNWMVSLDSNIYINPLNAHTTEGYTPLPALLVTSWYRRTVTSGRCIDSTANVKITVLPKINSASNLIISPPEEICHGMLFTNLVATTSPALTGGDNTYRYKWVSSITSPVTGYAPAQGVITNAGYDPVEASATFPGKEYFRRIVYSGSNDVCSDTSAAVALRDWPVITNNTITLTQTICSGTSPSKLLGSAPSNGNGTYTFTWQDSTKGHTWQNIIGAVNQASPDYQPPVLADTTRYRRIVNSSACSDISKSVIINVHKTISNNNVSLLSVKWDTTICSGAIPRILRGSTPTGGTDIPGSYAYAWESSASKLVGYSSIGGANGKDYQPIALNSTTYFRRYVISGTCSAYSDSVITVRVLPVISNNTIPTDFSVCYNVVPPIISGSTPAGGAGAGTYLYTWRESPDGITWSNASGTSNGKDYQPPALTLPKKYKRIVKSGSLNCCVDSTGIITISINPLPTGTITTTTDTTVCGGSPVPVKLHLTGASKWKVIYTENGSQITINKIQAADTTLLITKTQTAAMATYNYGLFQVQDVNGCLATSLSGTRKIDVYKVPSSVPGADEAVCGATYSLKAVPSVGTGLWTWSKISTATGPGNVVFTPNNTVATAGVKVDSLTAAWGPENKYKFIWTETNWVCTDKDSVVITFNQRTQPINPGPPKELYSLDKIDTLMALNPLVGTAVWSVISGGATISKDSIVSGLSAGENKFEWKITNGACESKGQYIINVSELKIPQGFSPNGDNINDEFIIQGLDTVYAEASLRILNSAGTEVFYTTNANGNTWSSWKGENGNGILPEGTYYYLLVIKSKRNTNIMSRSGFIILKRINSN
jgi:gliding motility-associated-like protein